MHACLHELASDPRNLLMVLSGQESGRMDAAFSSLGHASLAAEHGFCYRLGSLPGVRLLLGRGAWPPPDTCVTCPGRVL